MHRVYNSAFMHMLRDEDNAGYRKVMRDTLEFDPGILGAVRELPDESRRATRPPSSSGPATRPSRR